jgi:hypothetical protein
MGLIPTRDDLKNSLKKAWELTPWQFGFSNDKMTPADWESSVYPTFRSMYAKAKNDSGGQKGLEELTIITHDGVDKVFHTKTWLKYSAGANFKQVEEELAESNSRYKDRADQLAEIVSKKVMERIVPGEEPAPGINRFTGKPNVPDAMTPAEPPAPLAGGSLPTVDAANRDAQTVTIDGQEYEMVHLEPGGIRPRGGKRYAIPLAMLGIRSIGRLTGILAGNKVYVLPKGEQ